MLLDSLVRRIKERVAALRHEPEKPSRPRRSVTTLRPHDGEPLRHAERAEPPISIYEGSHEVLVVADVPGTDPRETELTWDGSHLTLEAPMTSVPHGDAVVAEWHGVTWHRVIELPTGVDPDRSEASYRHGVLTVRVPKRRAGQPRSTRAHA